MSISPTRWTCTEPYPRVFVVRFPNQYEVSATLMRAQEFYENSSGVMRGKMLSLEDFMDEFARRHGNFTYTQEWVGFNIPSQRLLQFEKVYEGQLLKKEQRLLRLLAEKVPGYFQNQRFYLVGVYHERDLDHEIAHAFYSLHRTYRRQMNAITDTWPQLKKLRKALTAMGYFRGVLRDEAQAYLASSTKRDIQSLFGIDWGKHKPTEHRRILRQWKKKQTP